MKTNEQLGKEAGRQAEAETRRALRAQGITVDFIARRLRQDLDRKETKTFKLKGAPYDVEEYIEQEAAKLRGEKPPKAKRRPFRILARTAEEVVVAVNMDCIDAQIDARKDAAKLLGLYVDQVELSGPDGGPIPYDSIPPERRREILAANEIFQQIIEGKLKPDGKSGNRKKKKN